jgi:hypothetical protein
MPKPTTNKGKETRAKREAETVNFLSEDQVRQVVEVAFPDGPPEGTLDKPESFRDLQSSINGVLEDVLPKVKDAPRSAIKNIRRALDALGAVLTDANIRLLEELGGAHYRQVGHLSVPSPASPGVSLALKMLSFSHEELLRWLNDTKAWKIVEARRYKPLVTLQINAGHSLPNLFEMTFLEKFPVALAGPGPRFVAAILREAGLRPDDGKTTFEFIKNARQEMLKFKPLSVSERKCPPPE